MSIVIFNPIGFRARYPEFAALDDATLSGYFTEATLYLSNSDYSPVQNFTKRALMLNMLVAHIAFLTGRIVGTVSNAVQGSVQIEVKNDKPGTDFWFRQTQYGTSFLQASLPYRSFKYISNPTNF